MTLHIDRTRMAMDGRFYAYDAVVPASEVDCSRINYFIVRGGQKFVSLADATRPKELDAMPRGYARYEAWKAHEAQTEARVLLLARAVYPELCALDKWPGLWIEVPAVDATHDVRTVEVN